MTKEGFGIESKKKRVERHANWKGHRSLMKAASSLQVAMEDDGPSVQCLLIFKSCYKSIFQVEILPMNSKYF